jgi:ketosteroid isomerase-like protein
MPFESPSTNSGPITLPKPVAAYFRAEQEKNAEAVSQCFTADALVTDDGHTYNGADEIQAWMAESFSKFDFTSELLAVEEKEDKTLVTVRATGNFPGSPIDFEYGFVLSGDKIAALEILV